MFFGWANEARVRVRDARILMRAWQRTFAACPAQLQHAAACCTH